MLTPTVKHLSSKSLTSQHQATKPGIYEGWEGFAWTTLMCGPIYKNTVDFRSLIARRLRRRIAAPPSGLSSFLVGDAGALLVAKVLYQQDTTYRYLYLDAIKKAIEGINKADPKDLNLNKGSLNQMTDGDFFSDFNTGPCGGLFLLLTCTNELPPRWLRRQVLRLNNSFERRLSLPNPLLGMAHGLAGIIVTLEIAQAHFSVPNLNRNRFRFMEMLSNSLVISSEKNIYLPTRNRRKKIDFHGWCHGTPGIALGCSIGNQVNPDETYRSFIRAALPGISNTMSMSGNLCCSNISRWHIYLTIAPDNERIFSQSRKHDLTIRSLKSNHNAKFSRKLFQGPLGLAYLQARLSNQLLPFPVYIES